MNTNEKTHELAARNAEQDALPRKQPKSTYVAPEVIDYGKVQELTRGLGSKPTFDMASGRRRT